jgi:hypothetical protein
MVKQVTFFFSVENFIGKYDINTQNKKLWIKER